MSGYLEKLEKRIERLEAKIAEKKQKIEVPAGYMNVLHLCRYFDQSRATLEPRLKVAVAQGKVERIMPKGGSRAVYSVQDVHDELYEEAL